MESKYFGGMGYELITALALFVIIILAINYGFIPIKNKENRMIEVSNYVIEVKKSSDSKTKKEFLVFTKKALNDNTISGREFYKITNFYNKHQDYIASEEIRLSVITD